VVQLGARLAGRGPATDREGGGRARGVPGSGQAGAGARLAVAEIDQASTRVVASPKRWLVIGRRADEDRRNDVTRMGVLAGSGDGRSWWGIDPLELRGRGDYFVDGHGWAGDRLVLLVNRYWAGMGIATGAQELWVSP